jgi:DNA-binding CsgD family transcriptional regulator
LTVENQEAVENELSPEEQHRLAMQKAKGKRNVPKLELTPAAAARIEKRGASDGRRRLTPTEWETIKTIWATGNCTANELAKRFGINPETIYLKMKKLGIKKGAEATRYTSQVRKRLEERMNGPAEELADRIRETKENYYKWNKTLAMLTMKEIADAKASGRPMSAITANLKTYDVGAAILARTRSEQFVLLGLDEEKDQTKDLPSLLISEMTADEVEQVKNRLEDNDDDDLISAADGLLEYGEAALADDDDDFVVEGDEGDLTDT